MFDPNQFLETQITESNATELIPIPEAEYAGVIGAVETKVWAKKDDPSISGIKLVVMWDLDSQELLDLLGRKKVTVKQEIMLDLTESGGLDVGKGRNVGLGRLRAALNLNNPGEPFSFLMMVGRVARLHIGQRLVNDTIYPDIKGVARM